jgi:predicted nucleotidyltransferase
LNSVKIKSIDPGVVLSALEKWVEEIRRQRPEIIAAGYFGSYATGRYAPGSDLDVLVVLSDSPHRRFFDRIPELYPASFPVGMDIFAYTKEEIEKMKSDANPWIEHILGEITWVVKAR